VFIACTPPLEKSSAMTASVKGSPMYRSAGELHSSR
jgi:hypothetical protein